MSSENNDTKEIDMRVLRAFNRFILIFLSTGLCLSVFAQKDILDHNGNKTGLVNVNPDPSGEPWIAGGLSADQRQAMLSAPELIVDQRFHSAAPAANVDNSKFTSFRPVFNQIGGSCAQASTVGYVFTYEIDYLRGVAASTTDAQYPYGYTFSFVNLGNSNNGSNTNQGWSIIQYNGIPAIADYGSISGNSSTTLWMSGYDKYFRGMANRTLSQFTIGVIPDSGMRNMKLWLSNHADGETQGGCLVAAVQATGWKQKKLPSASPETGFPCLIGMGASGGHALSIVGYNDSIFYDIDSNGVISDNERGGVMVVNSWGTSFGSAGKAYIMYDVLRRTSAGSIDGNRLYGVKVVKNSTVQMAFKVNLTHDTRNLLKITAGISANASATAPSGTPIGYSYAFNYAGGAFPLAGSGGSSTLEIGLDVSSLLTTMGTAKNAKLFLIVASKGGSGQVNSFSVMDYRGATPVEIPCTQSNVTIQPGSSSAAVTTYLSVAIGATGVNPVQPSVNANAGVVLSYKNSQLYYQAPGRSAAGKTAVKVSLYNAKGALVRTFVNGQVSPGFYSIDFSAIPLAAGMYLCGMEAAGMSKAIPIVIK